MQLIKKMITQTVVYRTVLILMAIDLNKQQELDADAKAN